MLPSSDQAAQKYEEAAAAAVEACAEDTNGQTCYICMDGAAEEGSAEAASVLAGAGSKAPHQEPRHEAWPEADASLLVEDTVTLAVQVNGKMRGKVELAADASQADAMALAMAQENIAKFVQDEANIKKIIYVPGKILNVVAPPAKK